MKTFAPLRILSLLILFGAPLRALVVGYDPVSPGPLGDPNSSNYVVTYNQVVDGVNLNGEVMLNIFYNDGGAATCTGSLLSDGESILTAGHCIAPVDPFDSSQLLTPTAVYVYFDQSNPSCSGWFCGASIVTDTANYFVDPSWTANVGLLGNGDDLAVVRLNSPAPAGAVGYSLYTGPLTTSDTLLLAGVGQSGAGFIDPGNYPAGISFGATPGFMRQGQNQYIGTCAEVFPGQCSADSLLGAFYASSTVPDQVTLAPGDSGGGSFFNGQLVGVHSFMDCLPSDCSITGTSLFGDTYVGGSNAKWIESVEVSTPEPESALLAGLGFAALALMARRSRRTA